MKKLDINIHHLTRVEGHGNIVVNYEKGKVEEFKLEIVESPRFFEAMLQGRHFSEAPQITARICGICAVGHTLASLRACEAAINITPNQQTIDLRKIILHAEFIQSHVLHVYFLALPDFLNVGSVIPLAKTNPDEVKRALRLKKLANDICEILIGRKIHPISMQINGFSKTPSYKDLVKVKKLLLEREDDIKQMINLFSTVKMPDFTNEIECVAVSSDKEFGLYEGNVKSSLGKEVKPINYLDLINEKVIKHSTAKHAKAISDTYAVGALARININHKLLHPKAKELLKTFNYSIPNNNPFNNNIAQVIETVHCFYDSIEKIDMMLETGINEDNNYKNYKIKAGRGVGAVEVPRGILFHDYTINNDGLIQKANCIIPTGQNLASIERNIKKYVPEVIHKDKETISKELEILVRAYDPCISCSSHFIEVSFV